MRTALDRAEPLAEMLWKTETEGRDFSTPERRAGLEAILEALVKTIRDAKIADYYRRDFNDRVFKAFKQRRPVEQKSSRQRGEKFRNEIFRNTGARPGWKQNRFAPPREEGVSDAVKQSSHVVNALGGAKHLNEQRLLGLLLCAPHLIERYCEALARLSLDDPHLDRLRQHLLNLALSGIRLDKAAVERHLVREGIGELAERLKTHSVLQSDLKGQTDEAAREALLLRTKAQLADPDFSGAGDMKAQRDEALQRYLDSGANEDWEELQRLNGQLRSAKET
jgi:DNA primase